MAYAEAHWAAFQLNNPGWRFLPSYFQESNQWPVSFRKLQALIVTVDLPTIWPYPSWGNEYRSLYPAPRTHFSRERDHESYFAIHESGLCHWTEHLWQPYIYLEPKWFWFVSNSINCFSFPFVYNIWFHRHVFMAKDLFSAIPTRDF